MTDLGMGLSEKEAQRRLARNGPNVIKEHRAKSWPEVFLAQLNDPLIYVLAVAAGVSVLLGEYGDAAIIVVVVLLNAMVGTIQEGKAKKALDCLRDLQSPKALVIRDGRRREIEAARLVVGDIVCLETGARVPADLKLVEAAGLRTEESALTGESLPVEKEAAHTGGFLPEGKKAAHTGGFLPEGKKAAHTGEFLPEGKEAARAGGFLPEGKKAANSGSKFGEEKENGSGWKEKVPDPGINRRDVAYMSTMVAEGTGKGIVIGTGMKTEIGRIADMIRGEKQEPTPLQKRLGELGTVLSFLSLFLCAALFGIAVMQKRDVMQMLLTAISLAVAAVPEGLPAVVTICLALSVTRMVKAGTIVRRLPCVEALGSVNVICSDKTGTLTQNRMKAEFGYWDNGIRSLDEGADPPLEFLRGWLLCNNADEGGGDPTEQALLEMGRRFGISKTRLEQGLPRICEIPFSSEKRQMITCHREKGRELWLCKGAPDEVLKKCSGCRIAGRRDPLTHQARQEILQAAARLAESGYRVLGLAAHAEKDAEMHGRSGMENLGGTADGKELENLAPEKNWTFLGMVAMGDSPRPEVAGAVETLKAAGVDTVMITGDHPGTALAIGKRLGIAEREAQTITGERLSRLSEEELSREIGRRDLRIFARVSPAQKVQIVKAFQRKGKIVAMTGDGVNDAPSLKAADVGIAMGKNGTDVAKEAADLVLTDDHFATIGRAVEEGRGIYENIRKSVIFLLSSNLGELLTMFAAVAGGFLSPLKSCHVLWINLITDSLPALALGTDPCDGKALMKEMPRSPKEGILSRGGLACICFYGALIAAISLAAFCLPVFPLLRETENLGEMLAVLKGGLSKEAFLMRGQTYAFTVLGMSQLFHAVGMRDVNKSVFHMNHAENKVMILATLAGFALQLAVTEIPFLTSAFGTTALSLKEWGILLALASAPMIMHEIVLFLSKFHT